MKTTMGKNTGRLMAGISATLLGIGFSSMSLENYMKSDIRTAIYSKAENITPEVVREANAAADSNVGNFGLYFGCFLIGAGGVGVAASYSELRKKQQLIKNKIYD